MFTRSLTDAILAHGDKILVEDKSRKLSGIEISRLTAGIATHIVAANIEPGDRVGVSVRDQIDALLVFLALLRVGAVPVFLG